MKKLKMALGTVLVGLSLSVLAHGDAKPMYGGIVQVVSDVHYELVTQAGGAATDVVDHGKPVDALKMSGRLTVLSGTQKSEAELKPAGGNKLEAGSIKLAAGSKVVASIKGADGKAATVRFSLK